MTTLDRSLEHLAGIPLAVALLVLLGCTAGTADDDAPTASDAVEATADSPGDAPAAVDTAAPPEAAAETVEPLCPTFGPGTKVGALEADVMMETSGVAASRRSANVWWGHNDSGGEPEVYAFTREGRALGAYALTGAAAGDWEDMAADATYLYVGDIGDNGAHRDHVRVLRVPEPEVSAGQPWVEANLDGVEVRAFVYPESAHDAETLLVDPRSGDVYLVTKKTDGHSGVYRAASPFAQAAGPEPLVLERVADLDFGSEALPGMVLATGGDVSPAGDAVLILTYNGAFWWARPEGQPLHAAFAGRGWPAPVVLQPAHEAIAFQPDGAGYLTVREGQHAPIYHYDLGFSPCAPVRTYTRR